MDRLPKLRLLVLKLGCCHGPTQARGRYAHWARTHLHREALREVSRCRHAALDHILHRPTEPSVGDPEHCREMDDSPDDPGVANAWDSSGERGAFGGDKITFNTAHAWFLVKPKARSEI